ncbi:MAG: hypothetical protein MUF43_11805 [Flavobacterium sp.]|jgi:hypothetical protein|nr:hypothetical protein [Flavobacterium sp.]
MTHNTIEFSSLGLTEITEQDEHQTNGGLHPLILLGGVAAGVWGTMSAAAGLYDWGYNYAKRQMEKNWKK